VLYSIVLPIGKQENGRKFDAEGFPRICFVDAESDPLQRNYTLRLSVLMARHSGVTNIRQQD
jgi:hypothetical protein